MKKTVIVILLLYFTIPFSVFDNHDFFVFYVITFPIIALLLLITFIINLKKAKNGIMDFKYEEIDEDNISKKVDKIINNEKENN